MARYLSFLDGGRPGWGLLEDDEVVELGGHAASLDALIRAGGAAGLAGPRRPLAGLTLRPPLAAAPKILCIGVNYGRRDEEYRDGAAAPAWPSVFVRFPGSFVGHGAPLLRPPESEQLDYEGEIALVIGKAGRRIPAAAARAHLFGLTLANDGSVRDWLRHGKFNVTPGKNFDGSGSLGPAIVTMDEIGALDALTLTTRVNGEVRQQDSTANLIFSFERLISYLSTFATLQPGDLILTGTPTGAGARFDPPRWLRLGDMVEVEVPEIGLLRNPVADEPAAPAPA
jgi:5-carboxymethyl-2-hydroxymuconate isomerase